MRTIGKLHILERGDLNVDSNKIKTSLENLTLNDFRECINITGYGMRLDSDNQEKLLPLGPDSAILLEDSGQVKVLAGTGCYRNIVGKVVKIEDLASEILPLVV
jgi:hypothetical protein